MRHLVAPGDELIVAETFDVELGVVGDGYGCDVVMSKGMTGFNYNGPAYHPGEISVSVDDGSNQFDMDAPRDSMGHAPGCECAQIEADGNMADSMQAEYPDAYIYYEEVAG